MIEVSEPTPLEQMQASSLASPGADGGAGAPPPRRELGIFDIISAVAERHAVTPTDIRSERRPRPVIRARHRAMWLARRLTLRSLPVIGRAFGGRDHTTVLDAVRSVDVQMAADPAVAIEMAEIEADLRSRFELPGERRDPPSSRAPTT